VDATHARNPFDLSQTKSATIPLHGTLEKTLSSDDAVRSVKRAMQILRALQDLQRASLAELQRHTSLPKPTLLRLMHTLEAEQAVWRPQGDGLWRPAVLLQPTRILRDEHLRLVEAAMPALEALRERVIWPSDLAVRQGLSMRLLETTRRASGLAVNRDPIGHRIDLLRSAVGRAYLAHCPPAERVSLLRQLQRRPGAPRDLPERIETLVAEVLRQGYAVRDPHYGGSDASIDTFDDQLRAIAVPVIARKRVLGCINLVWPRRFAARTDVVARHLRDLQEAARTISEAWTAPR
jgi:IclR family transcriptional regulator, mhp operon transcriptional activator